MNTDQKEEGDLLAKRLIHEYWQAFTGDECTWNFYRSPKHYQPTDRWASREQWIWAAKECVTRKTKILFGLEVLLAEGFVEYIPLAIQIATEWDADGGGYDPEYYYDILAHLPPDNKLRRKHLTNWHADDLGKQGRAGLISVEDKPVCSQLASQITKVFQAHDPDPNEIEQYTLPRMLELGPLCKKYLPPAINEAAKKFCLDYLEKDRILAPHYELLCHDLFAGRIDERIQWISGDIAYLCWRLGWFEVMSALRNESWYWRSIYSELNPDIENTNLLVWSQYAREDIMYHKALQVMKTDPYSRLDGAIAWMRMADCKWPPQ